MLPALAISFFNGETASAHAFLVTVLLTVAIGSALVRLPKGRGIYAKEGFVTVALGWIFISLFGALPFFISGTIPSFMDCCRRDAPASPPPARASCRRERLPLGSSTGAASPLAGRHGGAGLYAGRVPLTRGEGETCFLDARRKPRPSVGKLYPTHRRTSRVPSNYAIYIAMTLLLICC